MKGLLHKKITKKGFTLAELLIVVAILAILVAVSIPIFTTKLADAKKATDEANVRACRALVSNAIMTDEYPSSSWNSSDIYASAIYDAENGCMAKGSVKGYGQGSDATGYTNSIDNGEMKSQAEGKSIKDGCLWVSVDRVKNEFIILWGPTT